MRLKDFNPDTRDNITGTNIVEFRVGISEGSNQHTGHNVEREHENEWDTGEENQGELNYPIYWISGNTNDGSQESDGGIPKSQGSNEVRYDTRMDSPVFWGDTDIGPMETEGHDTDFHENMGDRSQNLYSPTQKGTQVGTHTSTNSNGTRMVYGESTQETQRDKDDFVTSVKIAYRMM